MNKSIWTEGFPKNDCKKLSDNIVVDVLIIGGGITGISTAYHLSDSNLKVCLVEKNNIGFGVTSKTTGKLTYLQENLLSKITKYHNSDKAKLYINSQKYAINLVKDIVDKEKIDCNLEKVDSYIFSNKNVDKLNSELNLYKKLNIDAKKSNSLPSKQKNINSFYVDDTYVFHPLKYIYKLKDICLKKGISIYEHTNILSINKENDYYVSKTSNYNIKSKYVVLALHYPYFIKPFWMPLKSYIEKSYIEAFKVDKTYGFSAITLSKPTISTRYHNDNDKKYQIFLTNSHNACVKNDEIKNFKELLNLGNKQPDYLWSNKDIITIDSLPYIGSINKDHTFLIGTGYNTWGMTNGSLAGKILSDIILNKYNEYIELFNPKRGLNKGKLINFPLIIGSNAYSFIKSKLSNNNNVRYEFRNGKRVAIYTDENNTEHIVYTLCPHFKCNVSFNEMEKTWDCPCHGSRFDIDGNVIEGPSNYNICYKDKE